MAKGQYKDWITKDGLTQLSAWARDGLTDEEIADKIGINRTTLYDWKNKYSDIADALKKSKEIYDIEVENALHKKTLGYNQEVKKTFKVKTVLYENGKRVMEKEELQVGIDEVHIPADTTAQIFWLKNRKPEQWKDKKDIAPNDIKGEVSRLYDALDGDNE